MAAYLVRRTLLAAFTLLVISFVSFVVTQIPEGNMFDEYIQAIYQTPGTHNRTSFEIEAMREL